VTFAHPYLLLLLLLLPLLAWLKGKRGEPPAFVYSSVQLVRSILNISRTRAGGFISALRWLALALLILALAQPRLTKSETKITASGVDIVSVIDMSFSMACEDFELNHQSADRITMAKEVLKKFIEKRPSDRIGLVAFATQAFIATPLTLDHDFVLRNLDRLHLGTIDGGSTAIGAGLSTAINRLRELKSKSKIVILMTDGRNNAGKVAPRTAAEAAQALGIKLYTIGVGKHGESRQPHLDRYGRYLRDFFGNKIYERVTEDLDEDLLQEMARMTGGRYYRADNSKKFQEIYDEIDKLEKTEQQVKKYSQHQELFAWAIAPGLGLVLLELLLRHTLFRRLP
jgi:Ca-activated chloride channel homolog